jgi:hypothetical protein
MTPPEGPADVERLWKATTEKVKVRLVLPGVWRAMEAARPLTIEDGFFIIGFPPARSHEGGLFRDAKTNNIIERALEEEAGRNLRLRIIEGETLADWEQVKLRDVEAQNLQRAAAERRKREASVEQGWDGIMERVSRRYAEIPLRQLPQMQALYMEESIGILADAASRLLGENAAEVDHRSFARAIERVADRAQVPAAVIAYLIRQKSKE